MVPIPRPHNFGLERSGDQGRGLGDYRLPVCLDADSLPLSYAAAEPCSGCLINCTSYNATFANTMSVDERPRHLHYCHRRRPDAGFSFSFFVLVPVESTGCLADGVGGIVKTPTKLHLIVTGRSQRCRLPVTTSRFSTVRMAAKPPPRQAPISTSAPVSPPSK